MTTSEPLARALLDTSVVIDLDQFPLSVVPNETFICAITMAELAAGPLATLEPNERARRQARLQDIEAALESLPFDAEAARAFGRIYAATQAAGRKPRGARTMDLLIAAAALAHGLPLLTRNPGDFRHLESIGLDVRAV